MHDEIKSAEELRLILVTELFAHLTAEQQQQIIDQIICLLSDE